MKELIGRGRTADVYRYGEDTVVKVFHPDFTQFSLYEYETAKSVEKVAVDAPRVLDYIDMDDKKGIVYEEIKGISLLEIISRSPLKYRTYAKQFAALHAKIHNKPATGLKDMKQMIAQSINNVQSIKDADKKAILGYLNTLPKGNRLCHYDFHPGNVLVHNGQARVIDWMTAAIGDPHADVCRTALILNSTMLPPGYSVVMRILVTLFRKALCRSYIRHYLKITQTTLQEVNRWLLPLAAARLAEEIEVEIPYLNDIIEKEMAARIPDA